MKEKKPGDETLRVPPGLQPKKAVAAPAKGPVPPAAQKAAPSSPALKQASSPALKPAGAPPPRGPSASSTALKAVAQQVPIDAPPTDSFIGFNPSASSNPQLSEFPSGPKKVASGEAAPEVSQGKWRERVFTPRAVMSKEEVLTDLDASLRVVLGNANHVRVAFEELRRAWLPTLRQALEQAGGDGLDAWLQTILKPNVRPAMDPLFNQLVADFARLRGAKELAAFEEEAHKVIASVQRVLGFDKPRKLSFKVLERELEGKLEVDELFLIAVSDDGELTRRMKEIGSTMETLRDQIRQRPGKQPDGMFANFVRLKAEVRVLDAELRRRGPRPP